MLLQKLLVIKIVLFLKIAGVVAYKNSSLTLIIDDTDSMNEEIAQVKRAAIRITNQVNDKHSSVVDNVVLVTFNDLSEVYRDQCDNPYSARLRTITNSGLELEEAVSDIQVHGGGDFPECSLTGIKLGLEKSHPESCIFVFTDDDAKDKSLLNEVKRIAQMKQSQVVIALTRWDCPEYDTYREIAEATHGQVFCLGSKQLDHSNGIFNYVSECVKGGSTVMNDTVIHFDPRRQHEEKEFYFEIDDRTDYVLISATGRRAKLHFVYNNDGVVMHNVERTVEYADSKVIKFNPPNPGGYYVTVSGKIHVRITLYAKTDFTFDYWFFKQRTPSIVVKQPVAGEEYFIKISVTDVSHEVDIKTVKIYSAGTENTLADIPLIMQSRDIYISSKPIIVRPELLTVVVSGSTGKIGGPINPIYRKSRTGVSPLIPAPTLIDKTSNRSIAAANESVTISCKAIGVIPPKVSLKVKRGDIQSKVSLESNGEFVIRRTTLADAGQYTCIAENNQGLDEHTIELIVQQKPVTNIINEPKQPVSYGSTHELSCSVEAYPLPKITWRDSKGKMLPSTEKVHKHGLSVSRVLLHVKSNDTYICYAENSLGNTVSTIKIEVTSPFVIYPAETIFAHYGKPKDLNCKISSEHPLRIRWFLNYGSPKATEIYTSDKYTVSENSYTLQINSLDSNNDGKYTCEASLITDENEKAVFTSHVQIDDIEHPKIISLEVPGIIRKSQTLRANCRASGNPKPIISWQFKPNDSKEYVGITGEVNLEIRNVGYEHAGYYRCLASNVNGTVPSISSAVTVEGAPSITNNDSVYYGVIGDKVMKVPCYVTGHPKPSITWKIGTTIITNGTKLVTKNNALYIMSPNENDTESFTCEAKNPLGSDTRIFKTAIDSFPSGPNFFANKIYLLIGQSIDLNCTLQHSGTDSIRWYVNGESTSNIGPVYPLKNVTTLNDGNYTCRVSTDEGAESQNVEVDVGYEPVFKINFADKIINWYGEEEIIDCDVYAKPFEIAEWYYNDQKIKGSSSQLPITKWGTYSCKMSNVHGHVERTFNVTNVEACIISQAVVITPNTPLPIINETSSAWPELRNDVYETLTLNKDQILTLACNTDDQTDNEFIASKAKTLEAKCYMEDKFIIDGKISKINDIKCKNVVKHSVARTGKRCFGSEGNIVEVGFKRKSQFLKMYDVCIRNDKIVSYIKTNMSKNNIGNMDTIQYEHARPEYNNSCNGKSECCFKDGQFVNTKDVAFGAAQIATNFDRHNIVPVWQPCKNSRRFTWTNVEDFLREELENWQSMMVWSGASHYTGLVPRYLWKIIKMDESLETIVYVNDPAPKETDILCSQEDDAFLQAESDFKDRFTYTCPIKDFAKAMHIDLSTFDDDIQI